MTIYSPKSEQIVNSALLQSQARSILQTMEGGYDLSNESKRWQGKFNLSELHIDFMNALTSDNHFQYMKEVHPDVQPRVWKECLEVALNKLNGINAPTHRHFSATPFRNEISLCRMFLLGRESYLNKQGKTMLSKPIFKP